MTSLRHFGVVVHDLDRMLDFYCGIFGFTVVRRMDEHGAFLDAILGAKDVNVTTVKLGTGTDNVLLELLKFHQPGSNAVLLPANSLFRLGPTHIALTVDNVGQLHERLSAHGIRFTTPPQTSPDGKARVTFCFDPEENPLELVQIL